MATNNNGNNGNNNSNTATVQAWALRRLHTRGAATFATFGLAGCKGVAFCNASMLAAGSVWPAALQVTPGAAPTGQTLHYKGTTVLAAGNRYNYAIPGVAGTVQVAAAWFAGNVAPATLGVAGVALAVPAVQAAKASAVTSAVVAAANVAQAAVQATAVAVPAVVAATVAQGAAVLVAQATSKAARKGSKGSKAHASKVG